MKKEEPQVLVMPLNSKVAIPELRHEGDAGFDIRSTEERTLAPMEIALIPTGLAMEIPKGYEGKIESKSGLALAGLIMHGGVINSNYQGPIQVIVQNLSHQKYLIKEGDQIAQIMFLPVLTKPLVCTKAFTKETT